MNRSSSVGVTAYPYPACYHRRMSRYVLELHGARPWTSNAERRWHHMERANKERDQREAFSWLAKAHEVPNLKAVVVHATPLAKDRRWRQDVGGCFPAVKAAIDGLVDRGVLQDDDPTFVKALTFYPAEVGGVDGLRIELVEVVSDGDD